MADFLRCYTQYVNNYDNAIKLLETLEKRPAFVQLLQKCTNSEEVKGQSLYSYLIMPIQRPPRYELLLSDLLKNTSERHPDYNNIKNALQLIVDINNQVDEKKRQADEKRRVLEVAQSILNVRQEEIVAAHRVFLREGDLTSGLGENAQKFHIFLFNDLLVRRYFSSSPLPAPCATVVCSSSSSSS
jgi:hypothetical protein